MASRPAQNVNIRSATDDDLDEIRSVCGAALGWSDPTFDSALFQWKHLDNAFGGSLLLVAEDESGILAVRPFMRWRFRKGSMKIDAARAVDTATRPDAQGQGLFRTLTTVGLERLEEEGTGFVFNTPNSKSLPGYLKLGWADVGPVPLGVGLASPRSNPLAVLRVAKSRVAAGKRSLPMDDLGESIEVGLEIIGDYEAKRSILSTDHDLETLRWRYAGGPIEYRFLPGLKQSGLVVRLRQRGEARELVVAATLGEPDERSHKLAIRDAMTRLRADHFIGGAGTPGTITAGRVGPTLALRPIHSEADASMFRWELGDIEVF